MFHLSKYRLMGIEIQLYGLWGDHSMKVMIMDINLDLSHFYLLMRFDYSIDPKSEILLWDNCWLEPIWEETFHNSNLPTFAEKCVLRYKNSVLKKTIWRKSTPGVTDSSLVTYRYVGDVMFTVEH